MTALVDGVDTPPVRLAILFGVSTLTFLGIQLLCRRSSLFVISLLISGGLSLVAAATNHAYHEAELQRLPRACGQPVVVYLFFLVFWLTSYIGVPCIVLCRLIDITVSRPRVRTIAQGAFDSGE
jgi:hypothetical protein